MKRVWLSLAAIAIFAAVFTGWRFTNQPVRVPTHRLAVNSFEDQVSTNGRIEPSSWASARAEREGLIVSVPVIKGQSVAQGAPIAILDSKDAQADLASALSRIEEAKSTIQSLESGGRRRDLVDIEEGVKQHKAEIAQTERDLAIAERLAARSAGTQEEVRVLKSKIELLNLQIAALNARKPALVSNSDLASARARLREAQSAAEIARRRIDLSTVRAPNAGVVFQLDAKPGVYVTPGALIASVGQISVLKALIYVDEPELGRVRLGMPVTISWDALEGKKWKGVIEKIPTQIVPLGTRQVGEVESRIDNQGGELLPGTNVNVLIQTRRQEGVLLIPKEAVRSLEGRTGAYVVENNTLVWRNIEIGSGNVTQAIVVSGVKAGDLVALGPEANLKPGAKVEIDKP